MSDRPPATTPRPGRPAQIDLDRIVAAAMTMDPERLTMAAVAEQVGVTKAALYRWIAGRDELLGLVSAELRRRMEGPDRPTAENWRSWLVEHGHRMRREMLRLPGFAVRLLSGPHSHEPADAPGADAVTAAFRYGGAPPERAVQYAQIFTTAVVGRVAVEQNPGLSDGVDLDFDLLLDVVIRGATN
ncbi:TetR/AcrR family transcriptional regulator [Pseudonocardia phyllosphaerae]|uniref:TetR/AcrR family transcriptional regulator n=1 Tax=Pseudonocardia phyllosphaerae TaxID=3390502 RepID=UPI00397DA48B